MNCQQPSLTSKVSEHLSDIPDIVLMSAVYYRCIIDLTVAPVEFRVSCVSNPSNRHSQKLHLRVACGSDSCMLNFVMWQKFVIVRVNCLLGVCYTYIYIQIQTKWIFLTYILSNLKALICSIRVILNLRFTCAISAIRVA